MSVTIDDMSAKLGQSEPTPPVQPPQAVPEETPQEAPQPQADVVQEVAPAETAGQDVPEQPQDVVPEIDDQMAQAMPPQPVPRPITAGVAFQPPMAGLPSQAEVQETEKTASNALPPILPTYKGMSKNVSANLSIEERKAELLRIRGSVADSYRRGVFHSGEAQLDSAFDNFLSQTAQVRIPVLGPDGQPQKDSQGRFRYSQVVKFKPGESDETKLIKMMEYTRNPNGVFHLFRAGDAAQPLQIDLNDRIQELTAPLQQGFVVGPMMRFVHRVENAEGGGKFYDDVLKDSVKNPARRLYYLRSNAKDGPFESIRATRLGSAVKDVYPGLANLGIMGSNFGEDVTLSGPMYAIAMAQEAVDWASGKRGSPDYTEVVKMSLPPIKEYLKTDGLPMFALTADRTAKAFGISVEEATTVLGFDSDLTEVGTRFTLESLAASPTVYGIVRQASKSVADDFGRFILQTFDSELKDVKPSWTGGTGINVRMDWDRISTVLQREGVGLNDAFNMYIAKMGEQNSRKWIERALDIDFGMAANLPGKFRDSFSQGVMDDLATKLFNADEKIKKELAFANPNKEKLKLYRGEAAKLRSEIKKFKNRSHIPQYAREFFTDETVALGAASVGYSLVANMTDSIEAGYIGAFVSVLASVNPRVRRSAVEKYEDIKYALQGGEAPSEYAITLRRRIQGAPPGFREQIVAHLESVIDAKEQLRELRYEDGTPIISENSLEKGFAAMGAIASIENLKAQHLNSALNVRTDIGKFSTELAAVEAQTQQQITQLDELADAVRELRNYRLDPDLYDPNSSLGKQADAILEFYDSQLAKLETDRIDLENILKEKDTFANGLIAGLQNPETVEQFVTGERSLKQAIAVDLQRFKLTIPEGTSPDEAADMVQEHLTTLQGSLAQAAELNNTVNNAQRANGTANRQWVRLVEQEELAAFTEASNYFDKLRYDFKGARFDITAIEETIDGQSFSVFDQLYLGQLDLDEDVVAMLPISAQGTFESRKIAGLTIPGDLMNNMNRLFGRSAKEYMDFMMSDPVRADKVTKILKAAGEGDELLSARPIEQFIALREIARKNPTEAAKEFIPRLGIQADEFMHLVSALGSRAKSMEGKTGAVKISQLRERLLDSGKTNFYESTGFYGAMSARQVVDFSGRYEEARQAYRSIYIAPWREESTSLKRFIKYPEGQKTTDMKFLGNFVKEFQLDKRLTDAQLEEGVMKVLTDMNGGRAIDVNTPYGRQLRSIFTLQVLEGLSNYVGSREFNRIAMGGTLDAGSPIIRVDRAENYSEIATDMRAGRLKPQSGIDISNIMRLKDKDGNPLVDMAVIDNAYSLDELEKIAPEQVKAAKLKLASMLEDRREILLKQFDDTTSPFRQQYEQRLDLVTKLGAKKGGLGPAVIDLALQENGIVKLEQLGADLVQEGLARGIPAEQTLANFRENLKVSVIEYLTSSVTKPGQNTVNKHADQMGDETKKIIRAKQIDPEALIRQLGFVGDGRTRVKILDDQGSVVLGDDGKPLYKWESTEDTFTAERMRYLLGDEVYDHLKLVANTLYSPSLESGTPFSITGIAMPVSVESRLSKLTSYFRGVISLRWLVSEAAIRESLNSQFELTKTLLFNPEVGKDLLQIIKDENFTVERFTRVEEVLLNEIARNDALHQIAEDYQNYDPDAQAPKPIRDIIDSAQSGVSNIRQQASNITQQMSELF